MAPIIRDVTDRDVFEKPLEVALAFTQDPEHRDQRDKPWESHKYLEVWFSSSEPMTCGDMRPLMHPAQGRPSRL